MKPVCATPKGRWRRAATLIVAAGLAAGGCAHAPEAAPAAAAPAPPEPETYAERLARVPGVDRLAEEYGVELVWLRVTAGGFMLDLRYRVFDPERAAVLFGAGNHPDMFLVEKATGQVARVPGTMVGQLKQKAKKARAGRIYYAVFKNPNGAIASGAEVELHFSDVVVDGVPVM